MKISQELQIIPYGQDGIGKKLNIESYVGASSHNINLLFFVFKLPKESLEAEDSLEILKI